MAAFHERSHFGNRKIRSAFSQFVEECEIVVTGIVDNKFTRVSIGPFIKVIDRRHPLQNLLRSAKMTRDEARCLIVRKPLDRVAESVIKNSDRSVFWKTACAPLLRG